MSTCIVQLGRYGDIVNILPVARRIAEKIGKPSMMVSRPFADVLHGVSYVIPDIVDMPYSELNHAMNLAHRKYNSVIRTQVWGRYHNQPRHAKAYNVESWRMAGFEDSFFDTTMPLVFDRRNLAVEKALFRKLSDGRPMMLTKLNGGLSSPFTGGWELEKALRARFASEFQIVDLSSIRFKFIYDMIGLMDQAAVMVSIDTVTLHLGAASGVPTVALVNPNPWLGTVPRGNVISLFDYDTAAKNFNLILDAVAEAATRLNVTPNPPPLKLGNRPSMITA